MTEIMAPFSSLLLEHKAPADITIVGLGPGTLGDLSLAAWHALHGAKQVILRTRRHPCVDELANSIAFESCDDLYETLESFEEVYTAIVARVLRATESGGPVAYAVPGHPRVGEATTQLLLDAAEAAGLSTAIVGSASFVEPAFGAVGIDLMDGSQVVDAMLVSREHHPRIEAGLPLLVAQIYARWLASDVKLTLQNAYPDDHPVTILQRAGLPDATQITVPLAELDHGDYFDHLTTLYVPPLVRGSFTDLQEIVAHLRAPEGCPWDQEQTLDSLRHDLLSETVEAMEAIDFEADGADNSHHIAEELGDVLLVVAMLVQIATEEGRFQMGDVIHHIVTKLIRRHPHVFGDASVEGVDEVFANWEAIKAQEKAAKGQPVGHPLDGIPVHLPALEKARELQSKAAKQNLLDRAQLAHSNPDLLALLGPSPDERAVGALLWQLVALAHEHDINAENALRAQTVRARKAWENDA